MAGMLLMGVLVTGSLVALVLALIWLAGRLFPHERRTDDEAARATLRRRYAAGQITEAEYLRALHALGHDERLLV
ncbi:MAG TPA: hypothetical protein VF725_01950 [Ktedonobacterales bacterium]